MNQYKVFSSGNIPEITFPGITQDDFADAFHVLDENIFPASPDNPVYGFIHPFTGPGGVYGPCWWQLDTSLALCGTKWVDMAFSENVLRSFMHIQRDNGRIPLHGPDVLLNPDNLCSSLPKLFQAGYEIAKFTAHKHLIPDIYDLLKRYLDWWFAMRLNADTGLIEAIVEESLPGSNTPVITVETNVEVAVGCHIVAILAEKLGFGEAAEKYAGLRERQKTLINRYLWNGDENAYLTYDPATKQHSDKCFSTSFDTFKLKIAPPEHIEKMLKMLTDDKYFQWNGICLTSVSKTSACYNETPGTYCARQWEGSIWTLRNYTVIEGLEDIGRYDLSAHLSLKTVREFNNNYAEFLNPPDGGGEGVKRYSWSASQYIQILIEHIFGVRYDGLAGILTIRPNLHHSLKGEVIGLNNLCLPRGNRLSLEISYSDDGIDVRHSLTGENALQDIQVKVITD